MKAWMFFATAFFFLGGLSACRSATSSRPRLPQPADSRGPAAAGGGPGEFLFADAFDGGRSFVHLPMGNWEPPQKGLGPFRLEGRHPAAVTQEWDPGTAREEGRFVLYHDEKPACTFTARSFFVVHRVTVHSGQFEELGLSSPEDGASPAEPDFAGIVGQAKSHPGMLAEGCPPAANRGDFVWAHPQGRAPRIWRRLPEDDPAVAALRRRVEEAAMRLPFGGQAADYRREMPDAGPMNVRMAVFVSPDDQEYRVEDYRSVGETMCGGTGFEQWSYWSVRGDQVRLEDTAAEYRRIRLVLDLEGDGVPEFVLQLTPFANRHALFQCGEGACRKLLEDEYPFNECPC